MEWTSDDDPDVIFGLHWIEDTKEIYVLRDPRKPIFLPNSLYGGAATVAPRFADDQYQVTVLGTAESRVVLNQALEGWWDRIARATACSGFVNDSNEAASRPQ